MNNEEQVRRSEAARAMGRARTAKKAQAGRENFAKARQKRWEDPEARAKFSQAMREAWRRRKEAEQNNTGSSTQEHDRKEK